MASRARPGYKKSGVVDVVFGSLNSAALKTLKKLVSNRSVRFSLPSGVLRDRQLRIFYIRAAHVMPFMDHPLTREPGRVSSLHSWECQENRAPRSSVAF